MRQLETREVEEVVGGVLSANEGATLILALGAIGGAATFGFAFPIAAALYYLSN